MTPLPLISPCLRKKSRNSTRITETIMLCKKLNIKDHESAIDYGLHMLVQMYHLATSDVAILDSYCIAVSVLHHKKSLLVDPDVAFYRDDEKVRVQYPG